MNECLFCKIISGEMPAEKVYEDEYTLAFLDIRPTSSGHTLVIPKEHTRNLLETNDEALKYLITSIKKVARAVKEGMEADGINVHFNNEPAGGQVIFHTHAHIIPRFEGDGLKLWPQGEYKEGEEKEIAQKIQEKL